jgi:hypothetical protein
MADIPLLQESSGLHRLFDTSRGERKDANEYRQLFNAIVARDPSMFEPALREFGDRLGIGDAYGAAINMYNARDRQRQNLLTQTQPTTETYTPQHATFGAEQIFPSGTPQPDPFDVRAPDSGTLGATAMSEDQIAAGRLPPGPTPAPAAGPPLTFTGREAFQPAPAPLADYLGGATAQTPPVTRPGKSLEEIVRADPSLARQATEWYPKLEQADMEQRGNRAAIQFARAVNTREMTIEDAYDKYGQDLAFSPAGLKILDAYKDRLAAKKTEIQLRQDDEARTWARTKIAALRASGDPDHAALADALEAGTQSKEFATIYHQARELEARRQENEAKRAEAAAKRIEAERPIMVDNVPHQIIRDPDSTMMRLVPVPGVAPPRLDQLKGLDDESLLAIARTHPDPQMRANARAVREEALKGRKETSATQGSGAVKPTQASLDKQTKLFELSDALDQAAAAVKQHPEWIEGPSSMIAAGAAKSPDLLKKALGGLIPEGYNEFAANLDFFTAQKLNELAGSALTPGEVQRYAQFLPSVWDSPPAFRAKMAVAQRGLAIAAKFHQKIQGGMSDAQAREETKAELKAELAREEAKVKKKPGAKVGAPGASPGASKFMQDTGG